MSARPLPVLLLFLLAAAACGEVTGPSAARLAEPFVLGVGEVALIEPQNLLVGFESVSSDSRCPSDVDCITAGDAAVELWLRRPPSARETRSVHSDASQGASAEYDGFEVELLSLEPLPRSDAPVAADAYRARLVVR
jgi:hypothetical protein